MSVRKAIDLQRFAPASSNQSGAFRSLEGLHSEVDDDQTTVDRRFISTHFPHRTCFDHRRVRHEKRSTFERPSSFVRLGNWPCESKHWPMLKDRPMISIRTLSHRLGKTNNIESFSRVYRATEMITLIDVSLDDPSSVECSRSFSCVALRRGPDEKA